MNKKKKDYLKIYVAVDIKRKRILSLHVTSNQVHDSKVPPQLIHDITINQNKIIDSMIADCAHNNNKNFQYLSFRGIKPVIKIRKNSICKKINHHLGNKTVRIKKNNY